LVPHPPQWSGLFEGFTHAPSQQIRPIPHAGAHAPPEPLELPPLVEPLDVLAELPLELVEDPEPLPDPLELPDPEEDEVAPSSPEPSAEASVDPPEVNVDPPHAAAIVATPSSDQHSASACFIEFPSPNLTLRSRGGAGAHGCQAMIPYVVPWSAWATRVARGQHFLGPLRALP
jgi:hypothetical protein